MSRRLEPVTAGAVAAVVGFASTFAVVLQGLRDARALCLMLYPDR
jgi:predicted benzoate:H+ symporter BenE